MCEGSRVNSIGRDHEECRCAGGGAACKNNGDAVLGGETGVKEQRRIKSRESQMEENAKPQRRDQRGSGRTSSQCMTNEP